MADTDQADRTLWVGNLEPRVTDELLFELFLQAGPVRNVNIPKDREGKQKNFAFVEFKHDVSVPYALQLMAGLPLFGRGLRLQFRSGSKHQNGGGIPPGPGTPTMPSPRGPQLLGNGLLAPPSGPMGSGFIPPPIHRSASAPDALFQMDKGFHGNRTPLLGPQGNMTMPQGMQRTPQNMTPLGLPPGTPFSQGAAFQGLPNFGANGQGNSSPIIHGQGGMDVPPQRSMSSPSNSPRHGYDTPDRRNRDSRMNDDHYGNREDGNGRFSNSMRGDSDYNSRFDTPSGRGRDRDFDSDRVGGAPYGSESGRNQERQGRYGRDSRYGNESRDHDRYRDRSGNRSDYDRRGYDDSRNRRHYNSAR